MGQKINPLGFRLGTTQSHDSIWFAQPTNYSENLKEDKRIRDFIKNYVQKTRKISAGLAAVEAIVRIKIKKKIDVIEVIIYIGLPLKEDEPQRIPQRIKVKEDERIKRIKRIKELRTNVQKKLNCVNQLKEFKLAIKTIPNGYREPTILAEFIAEQLKNRISFRKAIKKAIELAEQAGTKGVQVQIAGRIDGKEIARVEWIREGRVPLQTVRAKIDYCSYTVRTIYGVLGIKVWIFLNKE
uniref:ribosomal protein S3 n=1 Tax=Chesneya acaulis TaxID=1844621 RepID=UPI0020277038|nr:ribosomal protein S3 [Chesneya acaulis]UPT34375.1 ribosomal protein S3 [Chesneya acaulis]